MAKLCFVYWFYYHGHWYRECICIVKFTIIPIHDKKVKQKKSKKTVKKETWKVLKMHWNKNIGNLWNFSKSCTSWCFLIKMSQWGNGNKDLLHPGYCGYDGNKNHLNLPSQMSMISGIKGLMFVNFSILINRLCGQCLDGWLSRLDMVWYPKHDTKLMAGLGWLPKCSCLTHTYCWFLGQICGIKIYQTVMVAVIGMQMLEICIGK